MEDTPSLTAIRQNVERIRERIAVAAERVGRDPNEITLVAVTKKQPAAAVQAVLDTGVTNIAENYVAEAAPKFGGVQWPDDAVRHLIGHLQSNKAVRAVETFDVVQSVDSLKLANRLDRIATDRAIILPVLLELRLSDEPDKTGFNPDQISEAIAAVSRLPGLSVRGLMGMAPFTENPGEVRTAFSTLKKHFLTLDNNHKRILSMGMSGDFEMAIEEGSTMVRIGTALFGARH